MTRATARTVIGTVLTAVVVAVLLLDATLQIVLPAPLVDEMRQTGFHPETAAPRLAIVMLICAITLAYPRTAILGAILTTAFLGGAIAVHLRLGEVGSPPQLFAVFLGIAAWGGLYLRNGALREALLSGRTVEGSTHAA